MAYRGHPPPVSLSFKDRRAIKFVSVSSCQWNDTFSFRKQILFSSRQPYRQSFIPLRSNKDDPILVITILNWPHGPSSSCHQIVVLSKRSADAVINKRVFGKAGAEYFGSQRQWWTGERHLKPCRKRHVGKQRRDAVSLPSPMSRVTSSVNVVDSMQCPQQKEWLSRTRVLPLPPQKQIRVTSLSRLHRVPLTELANLEQGLAGPTHLLGHSLMQRRLLSLCWST